MVKRVGVHPIGGGMPALKAGMESRGDRHGRFESGHAAQAVGTLSVGTFRV